MSDRREQIDKLLAEVESEAYARGWRDAIAELQSKAPMLPSTASESLVPNKISAALRTRGRPAKAIVLVRDLIRAQPGMTGAEIANALTAQGTPVKERTVRSCLRRLRDTDIIVQRKKRWHPRAEQANGGASETMLPQFLG